MHLFIFQTSTTINDIGDEEPTRSVGRTFGYIEL